MRTMLDGKMKQLAKQGLGLQKRPADIISEEQERTLWRTAVLGSDTPQKLLETMIFQFDFHFAVQAGQEHRNLRFGAHSQVSLKEDSQLRQYLEYCEYVSKTNRGGIQHRNIEPKISKAYAISNKERCIVELYTKYIHAR
ncbi:Zinc finger MYM-type protein 2 [Mizuhopecten yessoensis]|uniref:Zinc finger MYM-type protein 2 n=1 Tax=Mizuhopecten yessoensis TaxID=6573 RepID=A0A210PE06_MIZYE|nr:Zinc finger MYM-type protein 2 [Mizuhopecten yessoensis]